MTFPWHLIWNRLVQDRADDIREEEKRNRKKQEKCEEEESRRRNCLYSTNTRVDSPSRDPISHQFYDPTTKFF